MTYDINKYTSILFYLFKFVWYLCYYPHTLRDSVSPVCVIFTSLWGDTLVKLSAFFLMIETGYYVGGREEREVTCYGRYRQPIMILPVDGVAIIQCG